jgi:hypothetical protein
MLGLLVTMGHRLKQDTGVANIYIFGYSVFCGLYCAGEVRGSR